MSYTLFKKSLGVLSLPCFIFMAVSLLFQMAVIAFPARCWSVSNGGTLWEYREMKKGKEKRKQLNRTLPYIILVFLSCF